MSETKVYDNGKLLYIDPSPKGSIPNIEDLTIFVELEMFGRKRSNIFLNNTNNVVIENQSNKTIKFVGKNDLLTTNYTNIGGESGYNSDIETESIGINSISIKFDTSYVPMVTINFTDIRGDSLFKQLENNKHSEYSQLMQLPYPMFKLTIKGFYGRGTTYTLHLLKLESSFDTNSGNFNFIGEFIGYTYAFLADNILNYLRAYANTKEGKEALKTISKQENYKIEGLDSIPDINTFLIDLKSLQTTIDTEEIGEVKKLEIVKNNNNIITQLINIKTYLISHIIEFINTDENYNNDYTTGDLKPLLQSLDFKKRILTDNTTYSSDVNDIYKTSTSTQFEYIFDVIQSGNKKLKDSLEKIGNFFQKETAGLDKNQFYELLKLSFEFNRDGNTKLLARLFDDDDYSFISYNPTKLLEKIDEIVEDITSKNDEIYDSINDRKDVVLNSILKFKPTIGNVFKVLLAHSEIFMQGIQNLSKTITNSNTRGDDGEFLHPFPTYVDDQDNTFKWVGSDPKIASLVSEEITFVEEILNQLILVTQDDEYLTIDSLNFKPTLNTDIYYLGVNPYLEFRDEPLKIAHLLLFRVFEYYLSYDSDKKRRETFIQDEINNIISVTRSNKNTLKLVNNYFALKINNKYNFTIPTYLGNKDNPFIPNKELKKEVINKLINEGDKYSGHKTDELKNAESGILITTAGNQNVFNEENYNIVDVNYESYLNGSDIIKKQEYVYKTLLISEKNNYECYSLIKKENMYLGDTKVNIYNDIKNSKYLAGVSIDNTNNIFFDDDYISKTKDFRAYSFIDGILRRDTEGYHKTLVDLILDITATEKIGGDFYINGYKKVPKIILIWWGGKLKFKPDYLGNLPNSLKVKLINEFETYVNTNFIQHESLLHVNLIKYDEFYNISEKLTDKTPNVKDIFVITKGVEEEKTIQYLNPTYQKFTNRIVDELFNEYKIVLVNYNELNVQSKQVESVIVRTDVFSGGRMKSINNTNIVKNYMKPLAKKLYESYDKIKKDNKVIRDTFYNDDIKLSLYNNLKSIYEKWIGDGQTGFYEKAVYVDLIDSFKFIDRGYNNIKDELFFDVNGIINILAPKQNQSIMDVISRLLSYHKVNFIPLPGYINYQSAADVSQSFDVIETKDIINTLESSPSFICMYVGDKSKHLDNEINGFKNDSFDIEVLDGNLTINNNVNDFNSNSNDTNTDKIVAFGVNYGSMSQSMFTNINLSQKQYSETEESLLVTDEISKQGALKKSFIGQNLYNIYQTRSYEVSLTSMGNVQIQPMMYFQLNNIPMWHGVYLIYSVSHEITANSMTTTFTGQRMRQNKTPLVSNYSIFKKGSKKNKNVLNSNSNSYTNSEGNIIYKTNPPFLKKYYIPDDNWTGITNNENITKELIEARKLVKLEGLTGTNPKNSELNNLITLHLKNDKPYCNNKMFDSLKKMFLELKRKNPEIEGVKITGAFGSGHDSKSHTTYGTAIDFQLTPTTLNYDIVLINKIQNIARSYDLDILASKYTKNINAHFHMNYLGENWS